MDLIQCNMCSTWVCEDCNDVPVARLKPIINKCNTIHFLCKTCEDIEEKIVDNNTVHSKENPTNNPKNIPNRTEGSQLNYSIREEEKSNVIPGIYKKGDHINLRSKG